jgi:hypothetical protein
MIEKSMIKTFVADFELAVANLKEKYNVDINLGNISYTTESFRCKMEVEGRGGADKYKIVMLGDNGSLKVVDTVNDGTKEKIKIGASFMIPHHKSIYTIIGFNENATKNMIQVETQNGARYRLSYKQMEMAKFVGVK